VQCSSALPSQQGHQTAAAALLVDVEHTEETNTID
jgi:hypothetical protein